MGEGGVATMTFNRNNFITMNGSRLFTAKDVCDIVRDEVKAERERVCNKIMKTLDNDPFYGGSRWKYQEVCISVRGEP